jgi:5'-nucleotidase
MIAGFGNHEFDKGTTELLRKINGGDGTTTITHISDPYPGALAAYVCSNIVWKANGTLIAPPYVIRNGGGAKIAFIGADTVNTVALEKPENVQDVTFLNESKPSIGISPRSRTRACMQSSSSSTKVAARSHMKAPPGRGGM